MLRRVQYRYSYRRHEDADDDVDDDHGDDADDEGNDEDDAAGDECAMMYHFSCSHRKSNNRCGPVAFVAPPTRARYKITIDLLKTRWHFRHSLCEAAATTHSFQAFCKRLQKLREFGGTGFLAKEITKLFVTTPAFLIGSQAQRAWIEAPDGGADFCLFGPGQRRALNRMHVSTASGTGNE